MLEEVPIYLYMQMISQVHKEHKKLYSGKHDTTKWKKKTKDCKEIQIYELLNKEFKIIPFKKPNEIHKNTDN